MAAAPEESEKPVPESHTLELAKDRQSLVKMIGEALREAGVLVCVFGVLDEVMRARGDGAQKTEALALADPVFFLSSAGVALILWLLGAALERRRVE